MGHVPAAVRTPVLAHKQVTAVLVLYGLPWLLTGSILAHELMHAWLRLSNVRQLSLDVEEGLCQLMALLWLERQPPALEVCCLSRPRAAPIAAPYLLPMHLPLSYCVADCGRWLPLLPICCPL